MKYSVLFLDLDDTVLDFQTGQKEAFLGACREFGLSVDINDYLFYDKLNKECWKKYERGEWEKQEMLIRRYEIFLARKGVQAGAERLNALYGQYLSCQGQFVTGAKEGIIRLKINYKIYITTNGNTQTQRGRMAVSGLDKTVDGCFISDEIGFRKPDKRYFESCLDLAKAKKENVLVIGDSLSSDIKGAENAGLDAVWFGKSIYGCEQKIMAHCESWERLCQFLEK